MSKSKSTIISNKKYLTSYQNNMEQRTPEWHEARKGKVTASMASVIMAKRGLGKTAENYAKKLIADEIQDFFEEEFVSYAMQYGIDNEPIAIQKFEEQEFMEVQKVGFIEKGNFLGCSPDGLIGSDGGIEVKCPQSEKHISNLLSTECPAEYYDQIQMSMYVTGRKWWYFVSYNNYFKEPYQLKVLKVDVDLEWQKLFEIRLEQFKEMLQNFKDKL